VKGENVIRESDLYAPVKALLEGLGYEVKAEVEDCDVVANKPDEPVVIVELKLTFSLDLVLQGIDRQKITDSVYLAVPAPDTMVKRRNWRARQRGLLRLCRLLGLGLILVSVDKAEDRQCEILLDPGPYSPRRNKRQHVRLMQEFSSRVGDPNTGGVTRTRIMTAYRQDAVRCARLLADQVEMKVADIKAATGVDRTASILQKNHYGWFERVSRGHYALSARGQAEIAEIADLAVALPDVDQEGSQGLPG
jgi:hypothetical protein